MGRQSPSARGAPTRATTIGRFVILLMPALLLLVVSFLTSDSTSNLFWLGAVIQVLVVCYLISNKRAWHQPLGTLALVAYLIAVAWLWMAGAPDHWFVHLAQFVLLAVPL